MSRLHPDDLQVSSFAVTAATTGEGVATWPTDTEQIECYSPWCAPTFARTCECPHTQARTCPQETVAEPSVAVVE